RNRAVLFGRSSPSPGGGVRPLVTARATNAIPPADLGWWWTEVAIWLFLESMRQQIQAHKGLSCPLKASIAAGTFPRLPGAPKDCCGLHQWLWKVYRDGLDIPTRARRLGFDWPDWDRDSWLPPDCPVPTDRSDGPLRAANSTTNARFVLAPYKPKSLGSLEAYRSWEAGSHHYEAARYSEAIQAFQNAMKVEGDPERVAACKIAIAHSLQMSGSYRASQVWYDKVTQDPDVPQVIKEAARAGQRIPALSQPDSSMPPSPGLGIPSLPPFDPPIELDSTATADDFFEAASHQMQMALKLTEEQNFMASNYWQRAIGLWDRLLTIDPNNAFAHGERGTVYRHLGDFQQAKECYRRAAEIDKIAWLPKLIEIGSQQMQNALGATHQSADANAMRGLWEKALDTWTQVLTIDPNNALAHGERGTAYRYLGDFQQAKEGYRRAIEIDKVTWVPKLIDLGNAQTNSAIAATQQARSTAEALQLWQPALETLREVLTIDPNNAFAHGSLGTAYDWIGDKDRAEKCYRTAANLDEATWLPRLHELQVSKLIGIGSQQMQDALRTTQQSPLAEDTRRLWEAALHTWGQVLAIDPGNALAHGERGTAYRYLGDFRQAKECYRRAAEIDKVTWVPKLIDLGNAQRNSAIAATTQSGLTEHTRQMWEALIDIWRQLLDIDIHPNDAPVYYAIGTVYAYIGEKEQARISHAKAAQLDPKYKEFLDS
ncbi:MAG: tetratricopeptide repeat protein, partial [Actinobacteria bacterium]|nr:tetratricopeptide repeat protein [Actinomycetota bacterium]